MVDKMGKTDGDSVEYGVPEGFLSQEAAGRYLGLSYATIHRWLQNGLIPYYELPPGAGGNHKTIIRISRKELDEFIAGTKVVAS